MKKTFLFALLILIPILFYFSPIFPKDAFYIAGTAVGNDLTNQNIPAKEIYRQALLENRLSLWTNKIYSGYPLLAEGQVGALFPPHILLFRLLDTLTALRVLFIATFLFGGLGVYIFLKNKVSLVACLFAAITFLFSGFFVEHIQHINILEVVALFPWLLWVMERYLSERKIKYLFFTTVLVASQVFLGSIQMVFYNLFFLGLFIIFLYLRAFAQNYHQFEAAEKKKKRALFDFGDLLNFLRLNSVIAFFLILGVLLAAVQILPSYELRAFSNRADSYKIDYTPGPSHVSSFYYPISFLWLFVDPFYFGNPAQGFYSKIPGAYYHETMSYVGILPLFFSVVAIIFLFRKKSEVGFFLLIAIFAALLSFGYQTPFVRVLTLPGFNNFRVPARLMFYVVFSIVVLSAFGFDFILKVVKTKLIGETKQKLVWAFAAIFILIQFFDLWHMFKYLNPVYAKARQALYENKMGMVLKNDYPGGRFISIREEDYAKIFLKIEGWQDKSDLEIFANQFNQLPGSIGVLYGLSMNDGYIGLEPFRNQKLLFELEQRLVQEEVFENELLLKLRQGFYTYAKRAGLRYLITPTKVVGEGIKLLKVIDEAGFGPKYYLYEFEEPGERFKLVPKAKIFKNDTAAGLAFFNPDFDSEKFVILEKVINQEFGEPFKKIPDDLEDWGSDEVNGEIKVIKDKDNELSLEVKIDNDGFLIVNDSYFPGWKAYFDEKEVPIYRANYAFRAIPISRGEHKVKFAYRPASFILGARISLVGLILLLGMGTALFFYERR